MSDRRTRTIELRSPETDGRRRQLRTMLLTAADTARQTRRVRQSATRVGRAATEAVRDRISMLLSAAG